MLWTLEVGLSHAIKLVDWIIHINSVLYATEEHTSSVCACELLKVMAVKSFGWNAALLLLLGLAASLVSAQNLVPAGEGQQCSVCATMCALMWAGTYA